MAGGRTLIDFQKPVETRDATGGPVITWTSVTKMLARSIDAVRGREDVSSNQGDRQAAVETWLVTVQYRADLLGITDHRAVIDGINYNIRSAMDRDRRRRVITMELESGVAI